VPARYTPRFANRQVVQISTSDFKRGPIRTVLTRLVSELRDGGLVERPVRVLSVMGMRAEESPARRRLAPFTEYAAVEARIGHRFRQDLSMADIITAAQTTTASTTVTYWAA
jgi:hypothetical protein